MTKGTRAAQEVRSSVIWKKYGRQDGGPAVSPAEGAGLQGGLLPAAANKPDSEWGRRTRLPSVIMKVKIGQLAKLTDTQVVTIRYYEKEGLLGAPERTGSNYRVYGEKDVERLHFIRHCRRHGMGLSEIRALLAYRDSPKTDCAWIMEMIQTHIKNVDEQMASLAHLKTHLEGLLHSCSGGHSGKDCGIIRSLGEWEPCKQCRMPGSNP